MSETIRDQAAEGAARRTESMIGILLTGVTALCGNTRWSTDNSESDGRFASRPPGSRSAS
jgi:hypothetical protein